MYANDPSVGKQIPGITPASATPAAAAGGANSPGRYTSNPLNAGVDEDNLRSLRKKDAAFQHFKQKLTKFKEEKGEILSAEKCYRIEIER